MASPSLSGSDASTSTSALKKPQTRQLHHKPVDICSSNERKKVQEGTQTLPEHSLLHNRVNLQIFREFNNHFHVRPWKAHKMMLSKV
jgi:hypothetical protein